MSDGENLGCLCRVDVVDEVIRVEFADDGYLGELRVELHVPRNDLLAGAREGKRGRGFYAQAVVKDLDAGTCQKNE